MPPVITPTFKSTPNFITPPLLVLLIGLTKCQVHKVNQPSKVQNNQEGVLSQDAHKAGDFVSSKQYVVNTSGQLLSGYSKEATQNQFHGGTLFHDTATGLIWAENQVSLGAGETLLAKEHFEQWLWELAAAEIHHWHSDNGIFNAEFFVEDCKKKFQIR